MAPEISPVPTVRRVNGRPLILGHRGDSAHAPENTLAAVRSAIAGGADGIEVDLQALGDGAIALCHDFNLRRLTGIDQPTASLTAATARATDVGRWFSDAFRGEMMPLLEDLLTLTDPWPGLLNLELKGLDPGQGLSTAPQRFPNSHGNSNENSYLSSPPSLADGPCLQTLATALETGDRVMRCCLTSFDLDLLRAVRSRLPQVALGWLTAEPFTGDPAPDLNLCCYAIAQAQITPATIDAIHRRDRAVWAWTVDDRDRAQQLSQWGIDALITNHPRTLLTQGAGAPSILP